MLPKATETSEGNEIEYLLSSDESPIAYDRANKMKFERFYF